MAVDLYVSRDQHLLQALGEREEALATLLERPNGAKALVRLCGGTPRWLGRVGARAKPVIRVQLRRGVPGEVLDIQLRDANSSAVERVRYRCLAISSRGRIEVTLRDYAATWYAAELFAAHVRSSGRPKVEGRVNRPKAARTVSAPKQPLGSRCRICGRRKLSREEYAWRRKNGFAVWRCQHRRPSPRRNRGLIEAGGIIAGLVVCLALL